MRIYEDIIADNAPAGVTSIRNFFAGDNTSWDDPTLSLTGKHTYMVNYMGTYALWAMFGYMVYGVDPRGKAVSDGHMTFSVPPAIATYLQNLVVDICDNYGRSGMTKVNLGWVMPAIKDEPPASILGDNLLIHHSTPTELNVTYPFTRNGTVLHLMAVLNVDTDLLTTSQANHIDMPGDGFHTTNIEMFKNLSNNIQFRFKQRSIQGNHPELHNGNTLGSEYTGVAPLFVEAIFPHQDYMYPYRSAGAESVSWVYRLDIDLHLSTWESPGSWRMYMSSGDFSGQRPMPVSNRLIQVNAATQALDVIACDRVMTDAERYNIIRWLSKKHQMGIIEPVWPDMIQP